MSVADVLAIFRDTYGGTDYDMTRTLTAVNRKGETVKSPIATPFMTGDALALFRLRRERTICSPAATYLQVTQSRDWLPGPIGGVVWLGYDNPATTPHVPIYIGISQMPASYMVDGRWAFSRDCAWWAFRTVSRLANFRYQEMSQDIAKVWKPIEDKAFAEQAKFEEEALALHKKDPKKARDLLTKYSHDLANGAVAAYCDIAMDYLEYRTTSFKEVTGSGKSAVTFDQVAIETAKNYACEDSDITYILSGLLLPKLKEDGFQELFTGVELPLLEVLAYMEMAGVKINGALLNKLSEEYAVTLDATTKKIYALAGEEFNINSPQQMGKILFEKLKLPGAKKTKTGYSTDISVLTNLARVHPLPAEILSFRTPSKLKSTYIDNLPELINPKTNRVHTSFNQTVGSFELRVLVAARRFKELDAATGEEIAEPAPVERAAGRPRRRLDPARQPLDFRERWPLRRAGDAGADGGRAQDVCRARGLDAFS